LSDSQNGVAVATHGVDATTLTAQYLTFEKAPPHAVQARRAKRWGWWYYTEYRMRTMREYWQIIAGYGILMPVLYLLAMGLGLGSLVDSNTGGVQGVGYLMFVGPSLLVTSLVMESIGEGTYTIMDYFTWHRIYFGVASTPMTPKLIVAGEISAISLRMTLQAVLFWGILVVSGSTASGWSWLMIPIGVLAAMSFGAPLMAFSATRERDDFSFSFIQRFIMMPMFLFAGTFFPLEFMPGYLQWIGWISPMWHGTELARAVSFGAPLSAGEVVMHTGFLVALFAIGWVLAVAQYTRRLKR